jgi:hypothetical protein
VKCHLVLGQNLKGILSFFSILNALPNNGQRVKNEEVEIIDKLLMVTKKASHGPVL